MKNSMSRLISISLFSLLLLAGAGFKASAQDVEVSFQAFYDNLAPYGQWVYDPDYGNVWVPNEGGNFRPYGTRGHWVMTDYGNTWVSDDPWGWACYHYGRWTYDDYYGWVWIPGYEWAPAWVTWRYGDGYCGWAPLGPGAGLSFNCPESWWVFVPPVYLYHPDCIHYWRGPRYNGDYIRRTSYVNNYYVDNHTHVQYNSGPRREMIEHETHQPVQVYRFAQGHRPGAAAVSGQRVTMYRPEVNRNSVREAHPAAVYEGRRPIGAPQQATGINNSHPPAFHQEVQSRQAQPHAWQPGRQQPNMQQPAQQRGQEQQRNMQQPPQQRFEQQRNIQQPPQQRFEQQRNIQQPPQQRIEQQRNTQQPPQQRFEQQRNMQQPPMREPAPQRNYQPPVNREPQQMPQPQRNYQPPVNREPQHQFQAPPRPQMQPEPRPQQAPRPQPMPQRQAPPMQQPRPQMQQPRQAPPQQQPHQAPPQQQHGEGRHGGR